MTDQELFLKIDKEIKNAGKQLDMLLGQQKEKMSMLSSQFQIESIDDLEIEIEKLRKEVEKLSVLWEKAFTDLKDAYDWEALL